MSPTFISRLIPMFLLVSSIITACRVEPLADSTSTVLSAIEVATEKIERSATPFPTISPPPIMTTEAPATTEPIATEVSKRKTVIAIPIQQSNCRSSCSTAQSAISDTLVEGVEYFATGQDSTGTWLQFIGPHSGESCWVLNSSINLWWGDIILEQAAVPKDLLPVTSCSTN